ncbi:MAG: hypothetical protein U0Q11_04535 [Vicinamibacterales bacterium]
MNLSGFQTRPNEFAHLSLRDLLQAREQYHVFLMQHPNVVATAVGRYRIRKKDSWPSKTGKGAVHGTYPRTLENSEVRDYSCPALLVFVEQWVERAQLARQDDAMVPRSLYLPDGRQVPVCVIEAPKEHKTEVEARDVRYPINNIGGGSAILARVQGQDYAATVACLVSDGHKVYGLTNRHVAGEVGEVVYSKLDGKVQRIGVTAARHLTREAFTELYPGWPGTDAYVNVDVGLIDVDNLDRWTTDIRGIGQMGPMVDLSVHNISLSLIGCQVRGAGASSGVMLGEIHALFYRYKTGGGFEYISDVLIGTRTTGTPASKRPPSFATHPGDSGTLWMLDPVAPEKASKTGKGAAAKDKTPPQCLPLAIQWGRNMLRSAGCARPQSYALATFLSRVCAQLEVDPVRAWNIDQPDTWGAVGHFSIAACAQVSLSTRFPRLASLMKKNAPIISHDVKTIEQTDFEGLGSAAFVPMADVPDFFWKPRIAQQGFSRGNEGPNHFADMDQPGPDGRTLLDLCEDDANITPEAWNAFYSSVKDLMTGSTISASHRGILPFRVWQIFDEMVRSASAGKAAEFVCAAGVLTHYIGDACQPLHISFLHDGDPRRPVDYTYSKGKKAGTTERRALGQGVHSMYEDDMVNAKRDIILKALATTPQVAKTELVTSGFGAAKAVIALMRRTFTTIPPIDIVNAFAALEVGGQAGANIMWEQFGDRTMQVMKDGTHMLGVLWESAWALGQGETRVKSVASIGQKKAMAVCQRSDFLPSVTINDIGRFLTR